MEWGRETNRIRDELRGQRKVYRFRLGLGDSFQENFDERDREVGVGSYLGDREGQIVVLSIGPILDGPSTSPPER